MFFGDLMAILHQLKGPIYVGISSAKVFGLFTCITWIAMVMSIPLLLLQTIYMATEGRRRQGHLTKLREIILAQSTSGWLKQVCLGIFLTLSMGYFFIRALHLVGDIYINSAHSFALNFLISASSFYVMCLLFGFLCGSSLIRWRCASQV